LISLCDLREKREQFVQSWTVANGS